MRLARVRTAIVAGLVFAVGALLLSSCSGSEPTATQVRPTATPTAAASPATAPTALARPTATQVPVTPTGGLTLKRYPTPPAMTIDKTKTYTATMYTTAGVITFDLFASEDPITVNNFVFLARDGFYAGVKFHRIIKGFMVQSGDPLGTGAGGPGYTFKDEPVTRNYVRGTLAMANAGPNTNGSQFFIIHQDYPLPKQYTIFGIAASGLDALDKIANTPVTLNSFGEASKPLQDVMIQRIEIAEK